MSGPAPALTAIELISEAGRVNETARAQSSSDEEAASQGSSSSTKDTVEISSRAKDLAASEQSAGTEKAKSQVDLEARASPSVEGDSASASATETEQNALNQLV
jgi:hypothetical protein